MDARRRIVAADYAFQAEILAAIERGDELIESMRATQIQQAAYREQAQSYYSETRPI